MEKLRKTMMIVFVVGILFVPVISIAGSLEPSGPPGSTMKTLDEINISWHQKLSQDRFKLVLDNSAVLDKETNLVWQQRRTSNVYTWAQAINACLNSAFGGRYGWRLPTVEELLTVFDPLAGSYPWLPQGNLFSGQGTGSWWTISTDPANSNNAYYIYNGGASFPEIYFADKQASTAMIWCVRGGRGYNGE